MGGKYLIVRRYKMEVKECKNFVAYFHRTRFNVCIVKERIAVSRHFQSWVIISGLVWFLFIKIIILKFYKI